jgi:hypothetical protein
MNNLTTDELIAKIAEIKSSHDSKKEEIKNLTLLVDKKIEEMLEFERQYANLIFELNKRNKENVIR